MHHIDIFQKKLKYEDDESKENSIDSATKDNSTDSLKIETEIENTDVAPKKEEEVDTKDVKVKNTEATDTKDVEMSKSEEIENEVDATEQNITEIADSSRNQKQNDSTEELKENNKMENNNEEMSYQKPLPDNEKCNICGQFLNNSDIIYYQGHPQNAVEEYIALTNEKLVLASGQYLCQLMRLVSILM